MGNQTPENDSMRSNFNKQIRQLQQVMLEKDVHAGTLLNNLMSAKKSIRTVLGKDSLVMTR